MLKIATSALAAIRAHGAAGYPLEVCGFLVGSAGGSRTSPPPPPELGEAPHPLPSAGSWESTEARLATEAWPVPNAWESDPSLREELLAGLEASGSEAGVDRWAAASEERRFLVSPQHILQSMKRAREAGMDLVGVYHSHPNHPAIPSDFDRDAAWPDWSYVIVSVRAGDAGEVRSWVLNPDGTRFLEEEMLLF